MSSSERYDFVNPKAGISYYRSGHKAYASIAYANREPERRRPQLATMSRSSIS